MLLKQLHLSMSSFYGLSEDKKICVVAISHLTTHCTEQQEKNIWVLGYKAIIIKNLKNKAPKLAHW